MPSRQAHQPSRREWTALAIVFLGATGIWLLVQELLSQTLGEEYTFTAHAIRAGLTFTLVLTLIFGVLRWEGKSAATYGLRPGSSVARLFGTGAVAYLLPFIMAAAVITRLGLAEIRFLGAPTELIGQLLAVLVLVLLYESIPEELIFRGYIFRTLSRRFPVWATVIGQALLFCLFGFAIGAARTPDRLLMFLLVALSLGVIRAVSGSVFVAIGFHTAFQLATQPVLGSQWTAFALYDPDRWFSDIAYGLSPILLGPVLVIVIVKLVKRAQKGSSRPAPAGAPS